MSIQVINNAESGLTVRNKINANFSGLADSLKLIGDLDCSTNPNYPAATKGDAYRVSEIGLIGGVNGLEVGIDYLIYCVAPSSAGGDQSTAGTDFSIIRNLNPDNTTIAIYNGDISVGTIDSLNIDPSSFDGSTIEGGGGNQISVKKDTLGGANIARLVTTGGGAGQGLAIAVDASTIEEGALNRIQVKDGSIDQNKLHAGVAGTGLTGGGGDPLSVLLSPNSDIVFNSGLELANYVLGSELSNIITLDCSNRRNPRGSISINDGNAKTIALSNKASGRIDLTIELLIGSQLGVVSWFSGIVWSGAGNAPTLTTNSTFRLEFFSKDGGATWKGRLADSWSGA